MNTQPSADKALDEDMSAKTVLDRRGGLNEDDAEVEIEHESTDGNKIEPIFSFEEFGLSSELKQAVYDAGYNVPSAIQSRALPLILKVSRRSANSLFVLQMINHHKRGGRWVYVRWRQVSEKEKRERERENMGVCEVETGEREREERERENMVYVVVSFCISTVSLYQHNRNDNTLNTLTCPIYARLLHPHTRIRNHARFHALFPMYPLHTNTPPPRSLMHSRTHPRTLPHTTLHYTTPTLHLHYRNAT
jgi:hypothetical protein